MNVMKVTGRILGLLLLISLLAGCLPLGLRAATTDPSKGTHAVAPEPIVWSQIIQKAGHGSQAVHDTLTHVCEDKYATSNWKGYCDSVKSLLTELWVELPASELMFTGARVLDEKSLSSDRRLAGSVRFYPHGTVHHDSDESTLSHSARLAIDEWVQHILMMEEFLCEFEWDVGSDILHFETPGEQLEVMQRAALVTNIYDARRDFVVVLKDYAIDDLGLGEFVKLHEPAHERCAAMTFTKTDEWAELARTYPNLRPAFMARPGP